ncbi:PAS domain-containing sensor histidine kinase [Nitrospira moscoviensis]|uniref:histidine kinase n=1 Tax=Nitrospira moscoviensis TaxID=42253 RepID=A0A0K2GHE1_NITMO|nr:PAS domain S-box protein [Nitrospira moscoviensis]ALA60375.1 putative Histidine kinase [Nitrospira moscoviensis]
MSLSEKQQILVQAGPVVALTAAVFLIDVFTPLGWADWLLYFIPLVLTLRSSSPRAPYHFAAVVTLLMALGGSLSPTDIHPGVALLNRLLGIGVMWVFTWLTVRQKQAQALLAGAETARSQAEAHRAAAVAARELAEASALGALHRESQTARELLLSTLRLDGIIQSAMDAIITVDEGQRILLFNESAERMFRCPAKEALGQPLDKLIPARFREAHRDHVQGFGRSGVTSRRMGELGTVTGLRRDGEEFPVEAAISHITVEGKKFYTVILRDLTERKRAERLMRQSEERYRRLIAVSPVAIFVDRADRIIFINDAGLRLFGAVKADEILGKSPLELFHPGCRTAMKERIRQLLEGRPDVPAAEEQIVKLDGSIADVEVDAARFVDEEGPAIVAMIQDVSERKRLEEQLRKTERIAELGTVASGMAHEIGTPMNVILGRAEYLLERVKEEPVKKGLQTIIAQVERITKVMNQLLSFARRRAPERRPLDLKDVVDASVEIFQERLARNRIRVDTAVDPACPWAHADADQMNQVLINLIMNAVHAMPEGGRLRIGLQPAGGMVRLTVSDTGHGMPPDVAAHIFDPFFTTKEFGKGTGLGLTVVKGILEEHGGSISVESEVGKGTTFTVLLPQSEKPMADSR